jgi:hypothetical protein
VRFIALFVLLYGAYFAWRYQYFGHLLSNSAYYKRNTRNPKLLLELLQQCWPLFVLSLAAPYRRLGFAGLLLLGVISAYMLGFARVASSVSYFHRFLLPTLPALALLAAAGLQRIAALRWRGLPFHACSGVLLALLLLFEVVLSPSSMRRVESSVSRMGERMLSRARVAAFVVQHFPVSYRVAVGDAGVISYVLSNPIIDVFGLNDERLTHQFGGNHRKYNRALIAERPELFVLTSSSLDDLAPRFSVERGIVRDSRFKARYVWVRKIAARTKDYHYWVFIRRDLLAPATPLAVATPGISALRSVPEPVLALDSHVASLVDMLAVRSHERQARATGATPR